MCRQRLPWRLPWTDILLGSQCMQRPLQCSADGIQCSDWGEEKAEVRLRNSSLLYRACILLHFSCVLSVCVCVGSECGRGWAGIKYSLAGGRRLMSLRYEVKTNAVPITLKYKIRSIISDKKWQIMSEGWLVHTLLRWQFKSVFLGFPLHLKTTAVSSLPYSFKVPTVWVSLSFSLTVYFRTSANSLSAGKGIGYSGSQTEHAGSSLQTEEAREREKRSDQQFRKMLLSLMRFVPK